jgi:hypothetical protein
MKIKGIDNLTVKDLQDEINAGGKFVIFKYTISIIVMTFRRPSDIYFIKSIDNAVVKGLPFTLLSLVFGWWGFPWGLIYTPGALYTNLSGGTDVTNDVMNFIVTQTNGPVFDFEEQVDAKEQTDLESLMQKKIES